jgi:hypothetical protein
MAGVMDAAGLIAELDGALPGFRAYVASEENLFGGATLEGVFTACSWFVRRTPVAADSWAPLARIVSLAAGARDRSLADAACTCFLENVAAPEHPMKAHLEGEALRYWSHCERARKRRGSKRSGPSCG